MFYRIATTFLLVHTDIQLTGIVCFLYKPKKKQTKPINNGSHCHWDFWTFGVCCCCFELWKINGNCHGKKVNKMHNTYDCWYMRGHHHPLQHLMMLQSMTTNCPCHLTYFLTILDQTWLNRSFWLLSIDFVFHWFLLNFFKCYLNSLKRIKIKMKSLDFFKQFSRLEWS